VWDFATLVFGESRISLSWEGENEEEVLYGADTGKPVVEIDLRYYRLTELHQLLGEAEKTREEPVVQNSHR
jgi:GDPmannose 4,6-dehydratase